MGNCDWRIEPEVFITKAHWLVHKQMTVEAFTPQFDGSDRWLKKIFVSFNLWNSGKCQWPCREMPLG
jgi:hypothetical protein